MIYEVIFKLTYAAFVWRKNISKETVDAALERMRELLLRRVSGVVELIPTAALGLVVGIGPLEQHKYANRQSTLSD